eukprot:705051-Pelagomonas_calceolata.AAC.1
MGPIGGGGLGWVGQGVQLYNFPGQVSSTCPWVGAAEGVEAKVQQGKYAWASVAQNLPHISAATHFFSA